MRKILSIIGARPQFVKHAPVEIAAKGVFQMISVHTGQHYDYKMSQIFFDELKMARPDYNLMVGSGLHGEQTARMMIELEPIMIKENPDFVLVYGDTNSTLAGALVAAKLQIKIIHVEAGLRSFNRSMPEEVNRVITDHLSSILFVPTQTGVENLKEEGITEGVYLIGDVMYDMIKIAESRNVLLKDDDKEPYCFATIHRPYNTDSADRMLSLLEAFRKLPYIIKFAVHPRTFAKIQGHITDHQFANIEFIDPLSYFDTIRTIYNSRMVITDSGGLQKEAYLLKKKCITIRSETEWIETLKNGWNTLVFDDLNEMDEAISRPVGKYEEGLYGDGNAAGRIVALINSF